MKFIAHRGYWKDKNERNTKDAFRKAFIQGYGIETDIRDYHGKIVVSHNIADHSCFEFEEVLQIYRDLNCKQPIAINIKADGLQQKLSEILCRYKIINYFVFDMSVPEQVVYLKQNYRTFTRMSDYEPFPVLLDSSAGIWMDEWTSSWIDFEAVRKYRNMQKQTCIISPEIHGRNHLLLWKQLNNFLNDDEVMLCTDIPDKAEEYFYG